jgi:putative zinc finger/helix-turn-helix YgiT family protein
VDETALIALVQAAIGFHKTTGCLEYISEELQRRIRRELSAIGTPVATMWKKKCPNCHQLQMDLVTEKYEANLEHDAREYKFTVPGLVLLSCSSCGNRIIPDESDERLSDELRKAAGLLSPSEVRENRERLGLTQEQLAQKLDVSEYILSRWETGEQIQQHAYDKLLRVYFNVLQAREYLSGQRTQMEPKQIDATLHADEVLG